MHTFPSKPLLETDCKLVLDTFNSGMLKTSNGRFPDTFDAGILIFQFYSEMKQYMLRKLCL
jgi:hypothetical protein